MNEGGLEKKDDFQKQLEHSSTLTVEGRDGSPESATIVRVTKITPPKETLKESRLLAFAQAFEHPLKVYEFMLRRLYDDGRDTLTFDHPPAGGELPELAPEEREAVKEFETSPEEIRAAKLLLAVLESKNAVQADVMTHSRGIGYTAIAALRPRYGMMRMKYGMVGNDGGLSNDSPALIRVGASTSQSGFGTRIRGAG